VINQLQPDSRGPWRITLFSVREADVSVKPGAWAPGQVPGDQLNPRSGW